MTVDELMREVLRSVSENARAEELQTRREALLASYSMLRDERKSK